MSPYTLQAFAEAFAAHLTRRSCRVLALEIVLANETVQCVDGSLCVAMFVVFMLMECFGGFDVLDDDPECAMGMSELFRRTVGSCNLHWRRRWLVFGSHSVARLCWQGLAGQVAFVVLLMLWSLVVKKGFHTVVGTAHDFGVDQGFKHVLMAVISISERVRRWTGRVSSAPQSRKAADVASCA
jgi:hypothetical protein